MAFVLRLTVCFNSICNHNLTQVKIAENASNCDRIISTCARKVCVVHRLHFISGLTKQDENSSD
jgi:hypothetical protein